MVSLTRNFNPAMVSLTQNFKMTMVSLTQNFNITMIPLNLNFNLAMVSLNHSDVLKTLDLVSKYKSIVVDQIFYFCYEMIKIKKILCFELKQK